VVLAVNIPKERPDGVKRADSFVIVAKKRGHFAGIVHVVFRSAIHA